MTPSSEPSHRGGSDRGGGVGGGGGGGGHNICFYAELAKMIPNYYQNTPSYLELCNL